MLGCVELDGIRPRPMTTAALGLSLRNDVASSLAKGLGLAYSTPDDVLSSAAGLIAAGKIVAMARGRFEWGPRALGQRSILASPQAPEMRERLNRVIKKREPFRPFAPAVVAEQAGQWFLDHDNDMTPFMTTVARVAEARAGDLGAVTHVDGTARVQTVSPVSSPDCHQLLLALGKASGVPIALNTSLNGAGEPIVASEADALGFFMSHPVDAMVVEDLMFERR